MEVSDFRKEFLEDVKSTAATEGEGSNAAFVSIAASYLMSAEVLSDFTPAFFTGVGHNNRRLRVDGYVFDEFDLTFNLIISDYTGEEERTSLTRTAAQTLFDRLMYFVQESCEGSLHRTIEPSTPAADLVETLHLNRERTRKYRLILLTDAVMSSRITDIAISDYNGLPVECHIWDIDRIYRVCCSDTGRQDIEIEFKDYLGGKGIPCLEASSTTTEDYRSFLCIIPGEVLADIYDKYGSQLLEGNVRSFLSTKVAVNKKIRETILRMPQNFFAYNNGVSATAVDLRFDDTGRYITYAKDFQIINGGQTTASLSNARYRDKADLSQIYVQMKLTEVDSDEEKASELVRNISRSSNSQNKVSDADFFASHPFHVRMEQISRRLFAPATGGAQYETKWFYERARGQYLQAQMHMTKSQKDKFTAQNPKGQVMTKTDFAKVRNSWSMYPHIVSKGAQTNFMAFAELIDKKWSENDSPFNERYFKDTVALTILFKHTEWVVTHQPWYEKGYRANIVTYSMALLHKLLKEQYPDYILDLQLIWNRQAVPDVITNELVKITKFVSDKITDPGRATINVTQWCKRDACWESVKKCSIVLSSDIERVLQSKNENRQDEKEAAKDQNLVSEFEVQKQVLEFGSDYWKELLAFCTEKKMRLLPDQQKALIYAVRIPTQIPSAYQSKKLMQLLDAARANGFRK